MYARGVPGGARWEEGNVDPVFHYTTKNACRICGGKNLERYLDLGAQPPSNAFVAPSEVSGESLIALQVDLCTDCGLSQLSTVVSHDEVFGDYAYRSSSSRALERSFKDLANDVRSHAGGIEGRPLVADLGCNDGLFLSQLPRNEFRLLGVEPSSAGEDAIARGIEVEKVFFGEQVAQQLLESHGPADVLTTSNVLAHVDDIHSYLGGVKRWLGARGCFILEFPYLGDMLRGLWFDTVYHEHVSYLSISPLTVALERHGLRIFRIDSHEVGGSGPFLRVFIQHDTGDQEEPEVVTQYRRREEIWGVRDPQTYANFARSVARLADILRDDLDRWSAAGHRLGGYGAPAKGNTLLNYLGIGPDRLVAIADNTPGKIGLVTPGTHIPIVSDEEFLAMDIGLALLLSWNYLDFFLVHSEYIRRGGRFLCPFPAPYVSSRVSNTLAV